MLERLRRDSAFNLLLLLAMCLIAIVVRGEQALGQPFGPLSEYLYLYPIAVVAFKYGWQLGLLAAGVSLATFADQLWAEFAPRGVGLTSAPAALVVVLFLGLPFLSAAAARVQRRHAELSSAVSHLNRLLSERLSAESLLPAIIDQGIRRCSADLGAIYWREQAGGAYELAAVHGPLAEAVAKVRPALASAGAVRWAAATAEMFLAREARHLPMGLLVRDPRDLPSGLRLEVDWPEGEPGAPNSYLVAPLRGSAGHLGLLVLFRLGKRSFSYADLENLLSIAGTSQMAVEQAWWHSEVQREAWELGLLNELAQAAGTSLDLQETIRGIMLSLRHAFPRYCVELFHWDRELGHLALRARLCGDQVEYLSDEESGEYAYAQALAATRRPMGSEELAARGLPVVHTAGSRQYESFYGVPLIVGQDVVGALCFRGQKGDLFGRRERSLINAVAAQIAVAINSASLYGKANRELARRLAEQSSLQALAKEFNATLELDQVLEVVLGQCVHLTAADTGAVALWESAGEDSQPSIVRSIVRGVVAEELPSAAAETMRRVIAGGEALLELAHTAAKQAGTPWARARLCVPIRRGTRAIGAIYLEADRPGVFLQAHLRFINLLAEHAAIALENARLYDETKNRARELQLLLDVSSIVSASLDVDEVLHRLADKFVSALQVAFCHIALLDEEGQRLVIRASATPPSRTNVIAAIASEFPLAMAPRFAQVLLGGRPLLVQQSVPETAFSADELRLVADAMTQSALLVPLVVGERTLGVITLGEHRHWGRSPITTEKIDLCLAMAAQAAIAIENAQLFKVVAEDRRRTQHILASIADGVLTTDRELRILTFNPAAQKITGWQVHEVLGRDCCTMVCRRPAGDDEACRKECPLVQSLQSGETRSFGPIAWEGSGRLSGRLQVAGSIAPLKDGEGEVVGTVAIFRDVTREAELDRLKGDFVSMVSHEIRSPLASISAAADLLGRGLGGERTAEMLELIRTQSLHLGSFVEDVLNVSRLDSGALELHIEPTPILPLLRRTIALAQATTNRHTIKLATRSLRPFFVLADASKIEVVVGNLLRNAINYSPDGGSITVGVVVNGQETVVSVKDEGIGIPADRLERIFERFMRVDDGDAKTVYGHGLGLYIARGIVERHGGRIWVESQLGRGSCFYFTLPTFRPLVREGSEDLDEEEVLLS